MLSHGCDRSAQCVFVIGINRAKTKVSAGTEDDSYGNAMVKATIGLFKTKVIHAPGTVWIQKRIYSSNGSIGATIVGSSRPTIMCHQRSWKPSAIARNRVWPSRPYPGSCVFPEYSEQID